MLQSKKTCTLSTPELIISYKDTYLEQADVVHNNTLTFTFININLLHKPPKDFPPSKLWVTPLFACAIQSFRYKGFICIVFLIGVHRVNLGLFASQPKQPMKTFVCTSADVEHICLHTEKSSDPFSMQYQICQWALCKKEKNKVMEIVPNCQISS